MKYLGYFVVAIVLAAVAYGLYIVGSPNAARLRNLDARRLSDLQYLQNQIIYYWQAKQTLPKELPVLQDATRGVGVPVDPGTGAAYTYTIQGPLAFTLCANFNGPSDDLTGQVPSGKPSAPMASPVGAPYYQDSSWSHSAGESCFERQIDPSFYKPLK